MLSCFSCVQLFATLWTVAHQAPLSMGFSRQEYWSGLPCPSPEDLPDLGTELASAASPALQEDSLPTEPPGKATTEEYTSLPSGAGFSAPGILGGGYMTRTKRLGSSRGREGKRPLSTSEPRCGFWGTALATPSDRAL